MTDRSRTVETITARDAATRDRPFDEVSASLDLAGLLAERQALDRFWRGADNLYQRVRALSFLAELHRYHLPERAGVPAGGHVPYAGVLDLFERRFAAAIDRFLAAERETGPCDALCSALAAGYRELAFQTLSDQVKHSVRSVAGNAWMFQLSTAAGHPLRVRPELVAAAANGERFVLHEATPVRMDFTHSAWSDIFFLGMDDPDGAKVLNVSIDLAVRGRDLRPEPPVRGYFRVLDQPVLRLVSLDLKAEAELTELPQVFDFARDYLGLLKAAVIASGVVPPGLEGTGARLAEVLERLVGKGRGIEVVSQVRGIPKGSRLAVSTSLLASLIALCMRATGQTRNLVGPLDDAERRLIVGRAILGEWLGGSGGGWQDSGGLWPSIKLIEGAAAGPGDPEFGISRGRLLPNHRRLDAAEAGPELRQRLRDSLVLVHGGMAQNVGPILEMVTERYLLRSEPEWSARQDARAILGDVLAALRAGDLRALGRATHRNFKGPIQTIIPWATNAFTERLIERVASRYGERFFGFWMLGGMAGGGMGFLFDPALKPTAEAELGEILAALKRELGQALPFAMEPVVYDFAINEHGTVAELLAGDAPLPEAYYLLRFPKLVRSEPIRLAPDVRQELRRFGAACSREPRFRDMPQQLFRELFPDEARSSASGPTLEQLLAAYGFDAAEHEALRQELIAGRIGLQRNRLPQATELADAEPGDVLDSARAVEALHRTRGRAELESGAVAIVTLAAGAASRWTQGAGVVKALNPFWREAGRHRSFLDVHRAKARRTARAHGAEPLHVVTTSYLTHAPIESQVAASAAADVDRTLFLSQGRSIGLRFVPMARDLRFQFEETATRRLDAQAEKVRESLHSALIDWATATGEGSDYRDNLPAQCIHPIGHWYEVPNLLLNGTLAHLLALRPQLRTLLLHNVDTLGADLDPGLLGLHLAAGAALTFEVVPRRIEDKGGGLARVDGRPRLVESLALPREEDEVRLAYYNSMTTWIDVDRLLAAFGLDRRTLADAAAVAAAVRGLARSLPTYVTLKDVKKRWGEAQEDVYPVAQVEKLWGDMTQLPDLACRYLAVSRRRGQQLKDPAQLDGWLRDGSAAHVAELCDWE